MYQEQIEQLVILQLVDDEIYVLEAELQKIPQEIEELKEELDSIKRRQETHQERITHLETQQVRLQKDIEEDDSRIKKSKNKLMLAQNTKEYHAMLREMENMEKQNALREEERVAFLEELERQQKTFDSLGVDAEEILVTYTERESTMQERMSVFTKQCEEFQKKREKAYKGIPKPILQRYEFIRSRIEHPVIVPVDNAVCRGCNIVVPPQVFIDLQKGQQIIACPNCQRLTFWAESHPEKAVALLNKERKESTKKEQVFAEDLVVAK